MMDLWGFKKWRRKLGYTQVEAGEKLGLSRGAVQYWESEHRPVPVAVELACQELLRLWKQRPDFGPVTLLYADHAEHPISLETSASVGQEALLCCAQQVQHWECPLVMGNMSGSFTLA